MRWAQFRGLGPAPRATKTPVISSSWLIRILKQKGVRHVAETNVATGRHGKTL